MNCFEWDNICGPKPDGFDEMTDKQKHNLPEYKKAFKKIELYLTYEQMSMFWWTIGLKRSYEEWYDWFYKTQEIIPRSNKK